MIKGKKIVVTHNGDFHADDVFAVASLKIFLKGNIKVFRTRDENLIKKGDFVVDVGGIYDAKKKRFDHHQKEGAGKRKNKVPYASFGLVWKEYGEKISGSKKVSLEIEEKLVQSIDAHDNGLEIVKPINNFLPYTVSGLISIWNSAWDEKQSQDVQFKKAVDIAEKVLQREIVKINSKIKAEERVIRFYKQSKDKEIVVMDKYYPYESVLMKFPEPKFVVYPKDNFWRAKTIRKSNLSMESRKSFPKSWGGKMKEELAKISGVEDAVFCHRALFLASAKTKEGALSLAQKALSKR